jgi:hypothetical protein
MLPVLFTLILFVVGFLWYSILMRFKKKVK